MTTPIPLSPDKAVGLIERTMAEANVRINYMIHVAGAVTDPEAIPDALKEFFEDCFDENTGEMARLVWPWIIDALNEGNEEAAAKLFGRPGYILQLETPVLKPLGFGFAFSWGYTNIGYAYAATEADISRVAVEWAEQKHAYDREFGSAS